MTVGEKIRLRRTELGMTMEDLGKGLGVQRSAINKYEKDIVELKASQIKKLAALLNVSVFYILDEKENSIIEEHLLNAYRAAEPKYQSLALELLEEHPATKQDAASEKMA